MSKTRIIEAVKTLNVGAVRKLPDAKPSLLTVTDRASRNLLHLACSASCADLKVLETASCPRSMEARIIASRCLLSTRRGTKGSS